MLPLLVFTVSYYIFMLKVIIKCRDVHINVGIAGIIMRGDRNFMYYELLPQSIPYYIWVP